MESISLSIARRIVPELLEVLQNRAKILNRIWQMQPIGRRALAAELGTTERVLRAELDFLKQQGLLVAATTGMSLSVEGQSLLEELDILLAAIEGRISLAQQLSKVLKIEQVIVVGGDSDQEEWVKDTLGYQAGVYLQSVLQPSDIVAVTGGTTMAAVAKMMPAKAERMNVKIVPARGGVGENLSLQANTIASELAARLGGTSTMLHVPDRLGEDTLELIVKEPEVQRRLQEIRSASIVLHGIGDAMKMAERRQSRREEITLLREQGAVAEAFGYYFDSDGKVVHEMNIIGLRISDLTQVRAVMGVAGGRSKSAAIVAAAKAYPMDVLVTDEGAAKAVLQNTFREELR
ncbi:DNA-binding transcriptional regulator [Alicyclobacillus tolerans]|uniref:sugar-binding transcriptional regulator n=1 Tax=Alicyclobacillus tolerans TaxID=90970 RepID=UPI001F30BD0A|nr:sugar-binding domain-containing protein [Alicyclobacillus tolerans]MCF8568186.1 DNA-binding transcriptional regulator [Alicyclobacillus tolerans]